MTVNKNIGRQKRVIPSAEVLTSLGLFLLALLPRIYDLQRFVTADEAKWVYRSAQFLAALLRGDFVATSVNLTPAVTTTWLGSLGLTLYYQLNRATINIPFTDWLLFLPEFRTELEVLAATRWSMAIFTSLGVVAVYLLACRLFGFWLAFIGAAFVALDPHMVALSRILGHDAPAAVFMSISVLCLLLTLNRVGEPGSRGAEEGSSPLPPRTLAPLPPLILSGIAAGLAFLSKAPALFLVPFAGLLFLSKIWRNSAALFFWFKRFLLWGVVAYLTFITFWPAAWVDPLGRPLAVVGNAFLSATDQEEADAEGYWLVPDLGLFYYVVNGTFKLSPLVMIGTVIAIIPILQQRKKSINQSTNQQTNEPTSQPINPSNQLSNQPTNQPSIPLTNLLWLLAFTLLFTIFMTFGDKRSSRYILPAFPALSLIAAFGWLWLYQVSSGRWQVADGKSQVAGRKAQVTGGRSQVAGDSDHASPLTLHASRSPFTLTLTLTLSALAILLPYAPYYFTYFNPLVGGPFTAPRLVKIGWGEGLDQVGRFLQREGDKRDSRVGTAYASTVAPFFEGDLSSVTGSNLDYVILYSKQVQSGEPSPTFIRYFEQIGPIFTVDLNGIHYADIYPGPAVQPAFTLIPGLDHAILPKPIGFRPLTPYGHLGENLTVDVIWLADEPLPTDPSTVTLEPISAFDFLDEHNHLDGTPEIPRQITVLAQGSDLLTRRAENLVVSHHQIPLPSDLTRGSYALLVDERPLGEIDLRQFEIPPDMGRINDFVFGGQIALAAYQYEPSADYIGVTIAWRAQQSRLPDYTVFVQLLDAETNQRLAGVDTQPLKGDWPTSRWVKNEVVVDEYFVAIPPDLSPGFYNIIAGFYQPQTGQRLTLPDGRDYWVLPWTYIRK